MRTVEIPRDQWTQALDRFSTQHEGWLVSLDVLDQTLGAQPEITDLPLIGITAETGTQEPTITIAAAQSTDEQVTHTIHSPTHVRIEKTDEGADAAVQVESAEGSTAILRFKTAALPETVDGLVRH
jgi:hypothetical protein